MINMEEKKYFLDVVINKEKLSDGSPIFVANCTNLGIASQGETIEEAMMMIREAIQLYLEEMPEKYEELEIQGNELPVFSVVEVKKNGKTTCVVR